MLLEPGGAAKLYHPGLLIQGEEKLWAIFVRNLLQ